MIIKPAPISPKAGCVIEMIIISTKNNSAEWLFFAISSSGSWNWRGMVSWMKSHRTTCLPDQKYYFDILKLYICLNSI